jgi:hypothetical protein
LFTNTVGTGAPPKVTCESLTKPLPPRVIVMLEPETPAEGETDPSAGTGFSTFNVDGAEVPPPGGGLTTVTLTAPAWGSAGRVNVNALSLTNVVAAGVPSSWTAAPFAKPLPVMLIIAPT